MRLLGVALALGGWAITIAGLLISPAVGFRLILACVGIGVSLYGSLGVLNGYYLERAIWKR